MQNGKLIEVKQTNKLSADSETEYRTAFTHHELTLHDGDTIYMFSDGFADQFGGDKGKKFMLKTSSAFWKRWKELSTYEQRQKLKNGIYNGRQGMSRLMTCCWLVSFITFAFIFTTAEI